MMKTPDETSVAPFRTYPVKQDVSCAALFSLSVEQHPEEYVQHEAEQAGLGRFLLSKKHTNLNGEKWKVTVENH